MLVAGLLPQVVSLTSSVAPRAEAATACPDGGCTVTVDAKESATGADLATFNYLINVDNSRYVNPTTRQPVDPFPVYTTTESNSPIVREGDQLRPTVTLPAGRYLVSVRSPDHKLWGKHFTLPDDAADDGTLTVTVGLTTQSEAHPLPTGKIRVFVFEDNAWTNAAPDFGEPGLANFRVGLEEQTGNPVTVDYNNNPLCGGVCETDAEGFAEIDNLGPATYYIDVHEPEGDCNPTMEGEQLWHQTTTFEGGFMVRAGIEEGSDGQGAPGEQLWEDPVRRTAYWFGFVCSPMDFADTTGTGTITGQARNWQGWPPFDVLTFGEPVQDPFVALSSAAPDVEGVDIPAADQALFIGRGDGNGNFEIQNVPAGTYTLTIWDEQLTYIVRFLPVVVADGETVDVNQTDSKGEVGVGVSRWYGWLDGNVYNDANGNQVRDPGEQGIQNTDVDQRWRDGSIKEVTFTGPDGYYEYPTAEGGPLGKWFIGEQGFASNGVTGAAVHDEYTGAATPVPTNQGGALLTNQLTVEGHRATVDWGKVDYPAGEPGQIVGVTYWPTTRNEFSAPLQAHEDYEPGIPDVTLYLEGLGPDGEPNTDDDVVLNKYVTDKWQHPNASQPSDPGWSQGCDVRNADGVDVSGEMNPEIGPNCLETPITGEETKDGAFDGGYAFADYCPGGYDLAADDGTCIGGGDPVALVAGDYIVHAIMPKDATDTRACNPANTSGFKRVSDPKGSVPGGGDGCLYRPVREDDVNVDLGDKFAPQIVPPPCTGDDHVLDQSTIVTRSPLYTGNQTTSPSRPLCDKRLIVLENGQNANADFNMMTNFNTDPNGEDPADTRSGDIQQPGRIVGLVSNDIYFERNPQSMFYGEARPIGGIPVGIYQRVDTVCEGGGTACPTPNVNPPYDANNWRLFTTVYTSPEGTYEALLPSTQTFNCPIPQGPCPGMYIVKVNDPGTAAAPNAGYDPNLLTAALAWDVWPGLTTQLDTPLDPISGIGCQDPAVQPVPELLQVSRPYVNPGDAGAARRITIQGDFIGTRVNTGGTGGRVSLTDVRTGAVTTLTGASIVSWTPGSGSTPDTIVIQVPVLSAANPPGPKNLTIVTANANGGKASVNGITVHVLGTVGGVTYNPQVVNVPAPPPAAGGDPHALQNAIDAAAPHSLLVLSPGVYNENLLVWKPLKIQGLGPGGVIGAHELATRAPEDARFNVRGTQIDGRFFAQNAATFDAAVAAHPPVVSPDMPAVLRGADLTMTATGNAAYNLVTNARHSHAAFSAARTDGLGVLTGRGDGAGGIQLQARINNLQTTNNVLENNGGIVAGAIGLGQPYAHQSHNWNVRIANNRVIGSGGLHLAGGIGIFYDSDDYEVANNVICANFSVVYGGGVAHVGQSPGGRIHDNQVFYNDAVDSGGGVTIQSEVPVGGGLGDGSGTVAIDRNLIQSNFSGDDGGGIFLLDALQAAINIRNNMVVANGAAHIGGAITLDDSSNVRIVNNTVADNVSTGSGESSDLVNPHSAGLASEPNSPAFQATLPAGSPDFSNPRALFNNVFWNNQAYLLDRFGPGAVLVPTEGVSIDFEVFGTTNNADTFTPRYSTVSTGQILGPDGVQRPLPAGQGNRVGEDPLFVAPFEFELSVGGSRGDPQQATVTIVGLDPQVLAGDYHLQTTSPAVDRGVRCSNTPFPAPLTALSPCTGGGIQAPLGVPSPTYPGGAAATNPGGGDYDRQFRPQLRTLRILTPWDLGADELPGLPIPL